jgi:acyl-CoA reductase-like NAD-dependent aldehyde dehydrogenase
MIERLKTISPIDGRVFVERPVATATEVDRALDCARAAQRAWASWTLAARCEILGRAIDACVAKSSSESKK